MKNILLFLFLSTTQLLIGQTDCATGRYVVDIFEEVSVTENIKFGEGNEINGNFKELFFDIYEPQNDIETNRPLIVLAFGGSFITGNRKDIDWLCEAYARKGYVVASIDYRLYDGSLIPLPTAIQMQEVVIKSVGDMKAAIRFLRQDADNANQFGINPNMVIVGGISAGAITAMHTAMLDESYEFEEGIQGIIDAEGGLEGTTNDIVDYTSEVQAVINFSGGLALADWIDAEDPPFISIHDDMDNVVPYSSGFAKVFGIDIIYMEGSQKCSMVADSVSVDNTLYTIEDSDGHVSYFTSGIETTVLNINRSSEFVGEIVCEAILNSTDSFDPESFAVFPNPTRGALTLGKNGERFDVNIIDISGKLINTYSNTNELDVSGLKVGPYLLRLQNKSTNQMTMQQIILTQ